VERRGELDHTRLVEDGEQRGGHERNLDGARVDVLYALRETGIAARL
jgi:hypothetical protein